MAADYPHVVRITLEVEYSNGEIVKQEMNTEALARYACEGKDLGEHWERAGDE